MTPLTAHDAEQALRSALDNGDVTSIDAAAQLVDTLDTPKPVATLHQAALWYASQGLKVFPLSPGSKIPHKGSRGCKDASNDPEVVDAWWSVNPDSNIGLATGHLVDVVDIDGYEGQQSRAARWDDIFAAIERDAVAKVITPRPGGMHIYVPATGDGNGARLFPGVDYRGVGGYVVAPPSINEQGTYTFVGVPDLSSVGQVAA